MKRRIKYGLSAMLMLGMIVGCTPSTPSNPNPGTQEEEKQLVRIVIATTRKINYEVGDEFVKPTITAYYDDRSNEDVTDKAVFSGYDMSKAGEQTVTVQFGGISESYTINVKAKETPPIDPEDPPVNPEDPPVNPEDPPVSTDITITFKRFYNNDWMELGYNEDPFAVSGHEYAQLKLNGNVLSGTDVDNVPNGKYFNVHVGNAKLESYKFEWVDKTGVTYLTYTYTQTVQPETPEDPPVNPEDPPVTPGDDNLNDGGATNIPSGTNVDNISVLGIDNVTSWSKGRYFDVFDGVKAISNGKDITQYVQVNGTVNYGKEGTYELEYVVQYQNSNVSFKRTVAIDNSPINRSASHQTKQMPSLSPSQLGSVDPTGNNIDHPVNPSNLEESLLSNPVPTNSWFTGMFVDSAITGMHVNQYRVMNEGYRFAVSDIGKGGIETYNNDFDVLTQANTTTYSNFTPDITNFYVSNSEMNNSGNISILSYSDNGMKMAMRKAGSNVDEIVMTMAQGSPYIAFETNGDKNFVVDSNYYGSVTNYNYYDLSGNKLGASYVGDAVIVELVNVHRAYTYNPGGVGAAIHHNLYFLVNTPKGSSFAMSHKLHPDSTKLDRLTITPKDGNYMTIAPLGDDFASVSDGLTMINRLHKHAYAIQDRANASYEVNHQTNVVTTTFRSNVHRLDKNNTHQILYTLMPHQYKKSDATVSNYFISSMRGKLRFAVGPEFETKLDFRGVLPSFTTPLSDSFSRDTMVTYLNSLDSLTTYDGSYDKKTTEGKDDCLDVNEPYWNSKALYPLSQGLITADQLGEITLKNSFISKLKYILEDWYKYDGESDDRYLYYNNTWGALYTNNSDFGVNTRLTDHHFTFGYFVYASSVLAMYDSQFLNNYKDIINCVVSNYMNYDRNNNSFPYFRSFDSYNGHSWSDGFGTFRDGNNQESSGEALNSFVGAYLFGLATNNEKLVDASIYGYVTELYSIKQYWFDYDESNWYDVTIPASTGVHALGMIWGGKNEFKTWFGPSPEFIYGIQWLPTGEYLSSYALGEKEQSMLTKIYQSMIALRGGEPLTWYSNMWSIEALTKNNTASSKFNSAKILADDYPNELVGAYLMVEAMKYLGVHSDTDFIEIDDQVAGSIYQNGSNKHAMVWNASNQIKTIKIHVGSQVFTETVEPGFHYVSININ